jgi:hypothetical protein
VTWDRQGRAAGGDRYENKNKNRDRDNNEDNARTLIEDHKRVKMEEHA